MTSVCVLDSDSSYNLRPIFVFHRYCVGLPTKLNIDLNPKDEKKSPVVKQTGVNLLVRSSETVDLTSKTFRSSK